MSDRDFDDAGQPGADDDASLFNAIVNGDDAGQSDAGEQHGDERQDGGGDRGQGEDERPAARERDERGRYAEAKPQGEDRAQRGLRKEITGERGKRQAAEAERDAERREREADRQELARLRGVVEQFTRQQPQARPAEAQQPKSDPAPDRYTDPDGYDRWVFAQAEQRAQAIVQQQAEQRADIALGFARQRDPQGFADAVSLLQGLDPQANARVRQQMLVVPDAGAFLMDFAKQERARREIGNDPDGFRTRLRSELLSSPAELMKDPTFAQAMADYLRQQAGQGGNNGGPRNEVRLPPSLNSARGSGLQRGGSYGNSDRDVFEEVMRT